MIGVGPGGEVILAPIPSRIRAMQTIRVFRVRMSFHSPTFRRVLDTIDSNDQVEP